MWTADQRKRFDLEHRLLQVEGFPQFSIYRNENDDTYYGYGVATTNSGRKYTLYLVLPNGFPYERPSLYVTDPRPLLMFDGRPLTVLGYSHNMHTLAPSNGYVQICHWRDDSWRASILLHKVFLKGLLWLEAYEQHLATGRPLAEFVSTMVGAQ
jgi:hypothetical protein